jgi:hypothetical protein
MMSGFQATAIGFQLVWLAPLLGLICVDESTIRAADAQGNEIEVEIGSGPHYIGQGFDLRVRVVASGKRPRIDPPRIDGARVWTIGADVRPISRTGIGSIVDAENIYVIRFRVVAARTGTLRVPAIHARTGNGLGRSRPMRVPIQPVPSLDRPAAFLGGVGQFELHAEAMPKVVRAGQELALRIQVTGPAAWGMTGRPELARFAHLGLGMRIEADPVQATDEPPSRTFDYRLRPMRAGETVLPPVAISAFDPVIKRYITHVTDGVLIKVVSIPAFDPGTIDEGEWSGGSSGTIGTAWSAVGLVVALLLGGCALLVMFRRRSRRIWADGPVAARRYAARLARSLGSIEPHSGVGAIAANDRPVEPAHDVALRTSGELIHYLGLGMGRPAGALTPEEAQRGVASITDSEDLGSQAARLTARCDAALYGGREAAPTARALMEEARALFANLGRVKRSRWRAR